MHDRRLQVAILILLGLVIVSMRTLYLQAQDPMPLRAKTSYISIVTIPRAKIIDRNGKVLAHDERSFDLYMIPNEFDKDPTVIIALREIMDIDDALLTLYDKINQRLDNRKLWLSERRVPQLLKRNLSFETAMKIEIDSNRFKGLIVRESMRRSYPYGKIGSHVIGYIGKPTENEFLKVLEDESIPEHLQAILRSRPELKESVVGKMGIEREFDQTLRSSPGIAVLERDTSTGEKRDISLKDPEAGEDVQLTIDIDIQKKVEGILDRQTQNGCVVVLDTKSGEIVAIVNKPSFDPNHFVPPAKSELIQDYLNQESKPLLNRATRGEYQLGSIFKIITALAALEEQMLVPSRTIECKGKYFSRDDAFRCWIYRQHKAAHGHLDLTGATARSCNIFFYRLGQDLGMGLLKKWALKMGFGEKTGIGLGFESAGRLPRDSAILTNSISFAIGQADFLVTPIQVAKSFSIIANDGICVKPHIIKKDDIASLRVEISSENIGHIKKGMQAVCKESYGTAHSLSHLDAMGKTSSAQTNSSSSGAHSWFAGIYKNYAIVVLLEYAGSGSEFAAPIFGQVASCLK